jgi:hypothetical protein
MAIRTENRIHAKSLMINRREACRIKRTLFLNGREPIGFLFSHQSKIFHIIQSSVRFHCGLSTQDRTRSTIVKNISDIERKEYFKNWTLCTRCENNFIGLSIKEKYKSILNREQIFKPFKNTMIISKNLRFMLENPYNHTFPRLRKGQLKNAIFLK